MGKKTVATLSIRLRNDDSLSVTLATGLDSKTYHSVTWAELQQLLMLVKPKSPGRTPIAELGRMLLRVGRPLASTPPENVTGGAIEECIDALATQQAIPFLQLEKLRREIQDGQMEWLRHLRAVAGGEGMRADPSRPNDQQGPTSQHHMPAANHSLNLGGPQGTAPSPEALRSFVQVLQYVLNRS